jgi:hypothetical protein
MLKTQDKEIISFWNLDIVTYWVTVDEVWIGNLIYWTLTDRNYKYLQHLLIHMLYSSP